ncbi:DUF3073 family protein [Nocardia sp. JCM 34519.1]|uniref:DUF3073 family protein n=1 Tax=unclassified Nocardia TaxID=2637762 RepID=UPI001CE48975
MGRGRDKAKQTKVARSVKYRGEPGGGAAGVREPRRPVPPDDHLGATRPFDPDPITVGFLDPRS